MSLPRRDFRQKQQQRHQAVTIYEIIIVKESVSLSNNSHLQPRTLTRMEKESEKKSV